MISADSLNLSCELKGISGNVYALRHAVDTETITMKAIYDALVGIENHIDRIAKEQEG